MDELILKFGHMFWLIHGPKPWFTNYKDKPHYFIILWLYIKPDLLVLEYLMEKKTSHIVASAFLRRYVCRNDRNWIYASYHVRVPFHFALWRNRLPLCWTWVDRNSMPIYNILSLFPSNVFREISWCSVYFGKLAWMKKGILSKISFGL